MRDYRERICLIDGEYLAKCISQNFTDEFLIFEVYAGGPEFRRDGDAGIEVYDDTLSFNDVKHMLTRIRDVKPRI